MSATVIWDNTKERNTHEDAEVFKVGFSLALYSQIFFLHMIISNNQPEKK